MTRTPGPRASVYAVAGITGILGGLAVGRPDLVAVGAPFLLLLGLALVLAGDHRLAAAADDRTVRIIEGHELSLIHI